MSQIDPAELELFRDNVKRFLEKEIAPHYTQWEKDSWMPREIWNKLGENGLLAVDQEEQYGGAGVPYQYCVVVLEETARAGLTSLCTGLSVHSDIVAPYVAHLGNQAQKDFWLPKLVSGEAVGAIGMTEPGAGSDLANIRTSAIRDGDHYVINGSKTFITNGQLANFIIVVAKTDPAEGAKGTSLIVVETDGAEGFERGRNLHKIGMEGNDTSELFFNDVKVPGDNVIGGVEGQGFVQLMQQLPQERLNIAVQGVAAAERGLEATLAYVKERKAFGKRVIDFQNTQFKLAEVKTKLTVAKVFVDHCIGLHLKGQLDAATASMAKYWVTDIQGEVIDEMLQLHGGYGYMNEYPIAQLYKDARVQRIYGGTNEIMKLLIARTL